MLGKLIGGSSWDWTVFGKHPVAKDYFQIRLTSPMASAFAKWVDAGFQRLSENSRRNTVCSWRFWAKGQKKGVTLCGLGRSSSDSIGRPYPMMIIGEGALDQWEKSWHLMLVGLGPTWETLEYAATRRLRSLDQLRNDINHLETPRKQWRQARQLDRKEQAEDHPEWKNKKIILSDVREKVRVLETEGQLFIPLDGQGSVDPFQLAGAWHLALKDCHSPIPNTVFMGGSSEKTFLALYSRPLAPDDFSVLWSV
ncbi:MAG: type VI secretion system-associated protein TagF [Desulfosarcina sp.]|nr:type VI secretion system-associated protein TagF [Desulfosarcina sp.]